MGNLVIKFLFVIIMSAFYWGCGNQGNTPQVDNGNGAKAVQVVYTCPMHPEVSETKLASCPICGMDLVVKEDVVTDSTRVGQDTMSGMNMR